MRKSKYNLAIYLLIAAYLVYAGIYIYQTSFLVSGERYFVLFDDAMISMRYAKNFAAGHGLVWNPGEPPVEGYTNPGWVLWMSIFHLFSIPMAKMSLLVQVSGATFLAVNLLLVYKVSLQIGSKPLSALLVAALTAFYMPLNNWGLQGMEVSLLVLLLDAAVLTFFYNREANRFSPLPYWILSCSTIVRFDMLVPALTLLGFATIFSPGERKRHLIWGLGLLVTFLGAQTLFRLAYYGAPLPNTFYLKVNGLSRILTVKRGLLVLYRFIWGMNWTLVALPFIVLIFRKNRRALLPALLFLGQITYSVYVGGDAWEHKGGANRYIAVAIPMFFIVFTWGLEQLLEGLRRLTPGWGFPIPRERLAQFGLILISLGTMLNFNFLRQDPTSLYRWLLLQPPVFIEGNKEDVRIALAVRKITTPDAKIAVVTAGAIPYFAERPAIDLLGKNDAYIARLPAHQPDSLEKIRPGHMKWDYDYSIGELKPDIILQLWGDKETAYDYIEKYYTVITVDGMRFSARNNSPFILWEKTDP